MCKLKQFLWSSSFISTLLTIFLLITTCLIQNVPTTLATQNVLNNNNTTPSLFIFGDSTVDPGNNNYVKTIFRSDFHPYGIDFSHQTPTGRFTNGKLVTDFIASYVGIKHNIPAYLDQTTKLKDLITGVSFASAGSGYDPFTSKRTSAISMSKQLVMFDEYKKKVENMMGKQRMEYIVENGIYVISAGTNDIFYNFGVMKSQLLEPLVSSYLHYVLDKSMQFLQGLIERGAKKITVVGVAPVGCLPSVITLESSLHQPRKCVDSISSISNNYNQLLQPQLTALQASLPNHLVAYADIFGPLYDQFHHPQKYGFEVVDKGCCGSGAIEAGALCNSFSPICTNRSTFMFWDSIHPTERSYYFLFQSLRPLIDMFLHY